MLKNISFKSNIRLVGPSYFEDISQKIYSEQGEIIDSYDLIPEYDSDDFCAYKTLVEKGFTEGVRSCTAGVVVSKNKRKSTLFHLFNSKENIDNLHKIKNFFRGNNCILVGSKNNCAYSTKLFDKIERMVLKSKLPVTKMQGLAPNYEIDLAYIGDKDDVFICVKDCENSRNFAKTQKDLDNLFDKFEISSKDKLIEYCSVKEFFSR